MMLDPRTPSPQGDTSLADMMTAFERGHRVVAHTLEALAAVAADVERLRSGLASASRPDIVAAAECAVLALGARLKAAGIEGENLLVLPRGRSLAQPLVVFALARQASGAVAVQAVEIDRAAIAFSDGRHRESDLAYDRLYRAARAVDPAAIHQAAEALRQHAALASSRLSIAKARFDLQASYLRSLPKTSGARLESPLDATGVRDMALEARRLLDRAAVNILRADQAKMHELTKL